MTIYKDLFISKYGQVYEDTFRYATEGEEDNVLRSKDEAIFLQDAQILRCNITTDRNEHLKVKLQNRLEELEDFTKYSESHISKIEDEKVKAESRQAYADYSVSLMKGVARIVGRLLRAEIEVEDELAILCYNYFISENK